MSHPLQAFDLRAWFRVRFCGGRLEHKLRRNSPVRAWLLQRRENPQAASGAALLGALADPKASGWADRAVAYEALGKIDLAPTECAYATHLLTHALVRPPFLRSLLPRLGLAVFLAVFVSIATGRIAATRTYPEPESQSCMSFGHYYDGPLYGLMALPIATPFFLGGLAILDRRRSHRVRQAAASTLAQLGDPAAPTALAQPAVEEASAEPPLPLANPIHPTESGRTVLPATDVSLPAPDASASFTVNLAPLESQLGPRSLVRAWRIQRQENRAGGSAAALLLLLADPRVPNWPDRALAYQELSVMALSPAERAHAGHLMSHSLARSGAGTTLFRVIGRGMATAFLVSLAAASALVAPICLLNLVISVNPFTAEVGEMLLFALLILALLASVLTTVTTPIFCLGIAATESENTVPLQQAAAKGLAHVGGPECIVALADHVRHQTQVLPQARQALQAVLPAVTGDWYGRLPSGVNLALTDLAAAAKEDIALLALDALGRAGSGSAASAVERLAQGAATHRIVARAALVLPILLERRAWENSSATLLRPSQAASPEHLLRPAHDTTPGVANLLRASDRV